MFEYNQNQHLHYEVNSLSNSNKLSPSVGRTKLRNCSNAGVLIFYGCDEVTVLIIGVWRLMSVVCSLLSRTTKSSMQYKCTVHTGQTCFYSTSSQPMSKIHSCFIFGRWSPVLARKRRLFKSALFSLQSEWNKLFTINFDYSNWFLGVYLPWKCLALISMLEFDLAANYWNCTLI